MYTMKDELQYPNFIDHSAQYTMYRLLTLVPRGGLALCIYAHDSHSLYLRAIRVFVSLGDLSLSEAHCK